MGFLAWREELGAGSRRACSCLGSGLLPSLHPLPAPPAWPQVPCPDARSGGPGPGTRPCSRPAGKDPWAGSSWRARGTARRGHSGRWLVSSADGDIPHTLLGSPSTTFRDQVVGVFFSFWCFREPDRWPSKKVCSLHLLAVGLQALVQWGHGAATACTREAKQTPGATRASLAKQGLLCSR